MESIVELVDDWLCGLANRLENKYKVENNIAKIEKKLSNNLSWVWIAGWVVLGITALTILLVLS